MRSPSSVLLGLLKARDASPPDFLCPCDAASPAEDPAAPRRPARRPLRPRASTSALRHHDLPRAPSRTAALDADDEDEDWTLQRRQSNPDMFPRQYVRGDDGFYTLAATYSYHGQKVTCTSGVNSRPNNIDLSSDNGGDNYSSGGAPDSVVTSVDKNGAVDYNTLPHGWRPVDPKPYSDKLVIGASAAVAGILAILMFGFILWRKPLKARPGRSDNKDKLQKLWEDHSAASLETGIPGRDEDPAMSRVVRAQKRAFSRALARWKTKAKGKAGLKFRAAQRHMASSNSTMVISRPHSRAQTPMDWSPRASPVHTPVPTRPASPALSESAPTIAADDTRDPPRPSSPPATRRSRDRSRSASPPPPPPLTPPARVHQMLPDREDAMSVRDAADSNALDADSPLSPPAYRRSYGTQTRSGYGPTTGDLSSSPGIAADEPAHTGDRKQALPPASPRPSSPPLRPLSPAPAVDNDEAEPETVSLEPPLASDDIGRVQVRRFAHVATDDKTILASMAHLASQPHEPLPIDATAPSWDEDDDLAELVLREESAIAGPSAPPSAPPPDLLPQPPSRVAQRSLLDFASAPPPPADADPAASAPSAPPAAFEDDEFGPEGAMSASTANLPRYER
ncbi:hypothetical protein AURDEDRAFT_179581 [Auricularia subglabra TFB-10046 SS5]|nr:hypothetical protein AURDEDRAFT_179581 [Auricularia subglabra TFB-10046 SS5]